MLGIKQQLAGLAEGPGGARTGAAALGGGGT